MTVSTSKTNYPKVRLLKTLRHSFVKILQPSQKRLDHDVFLTGTTKELSIMPKTFVSTATIVKRPMPVGKSFFAVSSVLPALPATRPALTLKRNVAAGSIKLLMSAMAVINRFPIAPLLTNTLTMPGLLTANIGNALRSPAPVSA